MGDRADDVHVARRVLLPEREVQRSQFLRRLVPTPKVLFESAKGKHDFVVCVVGAYFLLASYGNGSEEFEEKSKQAF